MIIYKQEEGLGLKDKTAIAYTARIETADFPPDFKFSDLPNLAKAEKFDDLHPFRSLYVSTGWNLNYDVFHPLETWAARATPKDKRVDLNHVETDIIGHTTSAEVFDDDGNLISDNTPEQDIPESFHIFNNFVLYKYWTDSELQSRIEKIIAEIYQKKWFVSMECIFDDFDYAIIEPNGEQKIVKRNEQTAFLSAHLRSYGGTGVYENRKVGRLMRNMIFVGKGLVLRPGNPKSKIFANLQSFTKKNVYTTISNLNTETQMDELKKENQELRDLVKKLEATIAEKGSQTLQAKVDELTKQLVEANKLVETHKVAAAELPALKEQIKKLEQAKAEVEAKFAEVALATQRLDRIAYVIETLGFDKAKAEAHTDKLAKLSKDEFKSHIDDLKELLKTTAIKTEDLDKAKKEKSLAGALSSDEGRAKVMAQIHSYYKNEESK